LEETLEKIDVVMTKKYFIVLLYNQGGFSVEF